ncbi:unnamed protein product [Sphenostylis stenocarpa]|uniref:Uncharacterized protein n=1 Tax=Sphenostylis stenocarpa TaxID=92480 RepID=A0AA86VYL6_9FABA|nr:unnamed protein product [Sphenostylis stenocarpa]
MSAEEEEEDEEDICVEEDDIIYPNIKSRKYQKFDPMVKKMSENPKTLTHLASSLTKHNVTIKVKGKARPLCFERSSYGILINGMRKMGETRAAVQLLRKVEGALLKPDVLIDEMQDRGQPALRKNESLDKTIGLFKKIKDGIQPTKSI